MSDADYARTRRLAAHYLIPRGSSARLTNTLALVAKSLDYPDAQVNIVDDDTLHVISDLDPTNPESMPRDTTMCQFTVDHAAALAVDDLRIDARYADLPGIRTGRALSYLGVPLRSRESDVVGTLCVFDRATRHITDSDIERITQFGRIVEKQLELMRRTREQHGLTADAAAELSRAIATGEIVPWYEPVVDLATDRVVGYEAVARWNLPSGLVEDPRHFLPQSEHSDLVVDLERSVAWQALTDLRRWRDAGQDVRLNLNLSTRHLEIEDGPSYLAGALAAAGLPAHVVDLELTQTRPLADEQQARAAVKALRGQGHRLYIDDFGSGWSSIDWVLRLAVTGLKMDRVVTAALGTPIGDAMTRAVLSVTDEIGLDLIIEGVATPAHAAQARSLGYRLAQGPLWSPPIPASMIETWAAGPVRST